MRALLLVLIPATAHADLRTAEQLEADGAACGQAYLDVYNADPKGADADRALFGAGTCFARSHSYGAGISALELARKGTSPWAVKAHPVLAQAFDAVGKFADAATVREAYAKKYAAEADASDELRNAITARIALGEDAKALDDGKAWIRSYAAKQGIVAGQLALQLAPIQGAQEPVWLAQVIRTYKLSDADMLHAMARQGELAWAASCKGKELCTTALPADKVARCTNGERTRVDRRTGGDAAQAQLARAVQFFQARLGSDPLGRHDGAMAMLRIADAKLETYLARPPLVGLDFDPAHQAQKEQSLKRFNDWIGVLTRDGGEVTHAYEAILALKDPEASVAAAERIGILTRAFATTLATIEIPKDVRTGEFAKEKQDAFCTQMKDVAEPLQKRAEEAFSVCATKATELGVETPSTQRCRAAAGFVDPVLPPLHAAPPPPQFPEPAAKYATRSSCAKVAITDDDAQYYAGLLATRCGGDARSIWSKQGSAKAHAALGVLAWRQGDAAAATAEWTQAKQIDGKLAAAYYGLGIANSDVEMLTNASAAGDPMGGMALAMWAATHGKLGVAKLHAVHLPDEAQRQPLAVIAAVEGRWALAAEALDGYDGALAAMHLHRPDTALQKLPLAKTYDELIVRGAAQLALGKKPEARQDFAAAKALDATRQEATLNLDLAK